MALNSRGVFDPRFSFAGRPTVLGAMLARVRIYRPSQVDLLDDIPEWEPEKGTPATGQTTFTPIFQGPARVQPNQDWRARPTSSREMVTTIHNTRIQVPFDGNELAGGEFPAILVNDVVRVLSGFVLDGVPVDPNLTDYVHIVGNLVPSSNAWVRTLACNTDMTTTVGVLDG